MAKANVKENNAEMDDAGKFLNSDVTIENSLSNFWQISKAYFTAERKAPVPSKAIPVMPMSFEQLTSSTADAIYRLGHSSLLLRLAQQFILIDPVFSERASPVQWAGPKRFHQPPINIAALPELAAVIISHDHYDHLDKAAIKALASKVDSFVVPLKLGQHLRDWGIANEKIIELDWWQQHSIENLQLVATPAQHFSGRGLFDKDKTLWASWVIKSADRRLFYSGDTGYFSGFKAIAKKYGPFDYTMIETGAYNALWKDVHMTPEQSLQAHLDLQGRYMIPVHNGTFDLALHDWFEPFEKIKALALRQQVKLLTPIFGEEILLAQPKPTYAWWQTLMPEEMSSQLAANKI